MDQSYWRRSLPHPSFDLRGGLAAGILDQMKTASVSVAAILTLALVKTAATGHQQSELGKKADAVRATPAETNYTKIPWVTDLFEGFRLAQTEKRPVFLYMITGDPLADC